MATVVLCTERNWRNHLSVPACYPCNFCACWHGWPLRSSRPPGARRVYSANKLLPFSFLVIGARFWPEVEKVRLLDYVIFCLAAAVSLGYAWLGEGMTLVAGLPYAPWVAAGALLLPLFLGRLSGVLDLLAGRIFRAHGFRSGRALRRSGRPRIPRSVANSEHRPAADRNGPAGQASPLLV